MAKFGVLNPNHLLLLFVALFKPLLVYVLICDTLLVPRNGSSTASFSEGEMMLAPRLPHTLVNRNRNRFLE